VERIAIFAALQWDCRAVLSTLRATHRLRLGGFHGWRGRAAAHEVWLVKTGVGIERAAAAAAALGDPRGFAVLVSTGCAGGLAPALRAGDLIIATALMDGDRLCPSDAAQRLGAARSATAARLCWREGPILCSRTALASAASKRAAAASGAIAVEMEGAPIAGCAARAGVPFLSVRAVLDAAEDELTMPETLVDPTTGAVRPLALTGYVATHPGAIPHFPMASTARRAPAWSGSSNTGWLPWPQAVTGDRARHRRAPTSDATPCGVGAARGRPAGAPTARLSHTADVVRVMLILVSPLRSSREQLQHDEPGDSAAAQQVSAADGSRQRALLRGGIRAHPKLDRVSIDARDERDWPTAEREGPERNPTRRARSEQLREQADDRDHHNPGYGAVHRPRIGGHPPVVPRDRRQDLLR
jgi:nucleoside phosphorylase